MEMQSQLKVPVIDFSQENLRPGTNTWATACNDVRRAMEEYGCFEAKFNQVPPQLEEAFFAAAEELFNLPTEVKMRNTSDMPSFGYFGQHEPLPLYETTAIDNPTTLDGAQSFTNLMWPNGNDQFRETVQSFSELLAELNRTVMRMLFESYGIRSYCDYYIDQTNYLLRLIKYRKAETNESNIGLWPHIDKSFLAIIHQGHLSGLQVKTKDDQWLDVHPSPTSFVVAAGDALMGWSNDRIQACIHQVINKHNETRYSTALFSIMRGTIHIHEELVDEMHPIKYKSFDQVQLLHFAKSFNGGRNSKDTLKAFCGV